MSLLKNTFDAGRFIANFHMALCRCSTSVDEKKRICVKNKKTKETTGLLNLTRFNLVKSYESYRTYSPDLANCVATCIKECLLYPFQGL